MKRKIGMSDREYIEQMLGQHGLEVDSQIMGNGRGYRVSIRHGKGRQYVSDRMYFAGLKKWLQGFIFAKTGEPDSRI